jgi:TonB family protein
MRRTALLATLLLAAPAACAWLPCEQKDISPPKPVRRDAPAYPAAVRALGIEGSVEVALTVLRDGNVGWVRVIRAEPRGYFEQAASESVRGWRFEPARRDGRPVECRMLTRLRFALTDTAATAAVGADADRPQPVYPPALLQARIEGYVEVEYTLAADGTVTEPRLLVAVPRGEFERSALAAVRSWRGPPAPGVPARVETRRFDFRLPDSWLEVVPPTLLASAPFPMAACESGATGRVMLELETEASGEVREVRILSAEPEGLFETTALAIARGSRLSPAYRDGKPIPATALLTLRFDPARATCPNRPGSDRDPPAVKRPPPRVTGVSHDERPLRRVERWTRLSAAARQPVP